MTEPSERRVARTRWSGHAGCARTPALRRMVAETSVEPRQLVLPLFVREGLAEPRPISSMPGVVQHTARLAAAGGRRGRRARASAA